MNRYRSDTFDQKMKLVLICAACCLLIILLNECFMRFASPPRPEKAGTEAVTEVVSEVTAEEGMEEIRKEESEE